MRLRAIPRALAAAVLAAVALLPAPEAEAGRARWRTFPVRRVAGPRFLGGETFVARTPQEWEAAWRDSGSPGRVPPVDFSRRMVVGVHSGGRDGCEGFELVALRTNRDAAELLWRPTEAVGDFFCTAAVWQGWRFGTVPRTAADPTFRKLPRRVVQGRR